MRAVVAVDGDAGGAIAAGIEREGVEVVAVLAASTPARAVEDAYRAGTAELVDALGGADVLILELTRDSASSRLVAFCDRAGVRIVPLGDGPEALHTASLFALEEPRSPTIEPWRLAAALAERPVVARAPGAVSQGPRVLVVWGPAGAPGRTTIAIELAVELARGGRRVALVDADAHAPSVAVALGLADEGPGFAAACRQAEFGGIDARELARISLPLGRTGVEVLTGINRPSRWPELGADRVAAVLAACRDWVDYTVVDVAASLEKDEEIVSDLEGPRRNAATLAALAAADLVVAVAGGDPVGISRFLRAHAELRETTGGAPVAVVVNRVRPGALGVDGRGQVRRALDRFGDVDDVWFVPQDPRSADAALLAARPIAVSGPSSPVTAAIRRFVGEAVVPAPEVAPVRARRRRRAA